MPTDSMMMMPDSITRPGTLASSSSFGGPAPASTASLDRREAAAATKIQSGMRGMRDRRLKRQDTGAFGAGARTHSMPETARLSSGASVGGEVQRTASMEVRGDAAVVKICLLYTSDAADDM
eukprot:1630641-Rhodomonas_salina.1